MAGVCRGLLVIALGWPALCLGEGGQGGQGEAARTAMPEPLVGESITDIDSREPGEVELDVGGGLLGRTRDRTLLWTTALEAEWRANEKLGLAAELGVGGAAGEGMMDADQRLVSLRVAASWAVWNDWKRDIHLQAQASAQVFAAFWPEREFGLGESTLPYSFRLQGAWRRGGFNVRLGVGAAVRSVGVYTLLLENAAFLYEWGRKIGPMRRAFVGIEVDADGARSAPLALIPEFAVAVAPFGVPLRLGVAVPLAPALNEGDGRGLIAGALLRITAELDQD